MKEHKLIAGLLILTAGIFTGIQLSEMFSERSQSEFISGVMSEKYGSTAAVLNSVKSSVDKTTAFSTDQLIGITVNSIGYNVSILQYFLKSSGYFPQNTAPTQYFGQVTLDALKNFQMANGLTQTGMVDIPTATAIMNELSQAPILFDENGNISSEMIVPPHHVGNSSTHFLWSQRHTSWSDTFLGKYMHFADTTYSGWVTDPHFFFVPCGVGEC